MNKINLNNYNEFETDYIYELIMDRTIFVDGIDLPADEFLKKEDLLVNEEGDVYIPFYINNKVDFAREDIVEIDTDGVLLCTKEELSQAWLKEENPELYTK